MTSNAEATIIKAIEDNCANGRKVWDVYADWLDMTLATLEALPRHAAAAIATRAPADDTPEAAALWARLRGIYGRDEFERFRVAYLALMEMAHERMRLADGANPKHSATWDVLGSVYMQLNVSSNHSGQYFTPWNIAVVMANFSLGDIEAECRARVARAIDAGPMGMMGFANGASITQPGKEALMLMALAENYAYLDPITICDPACGSGVMLLAAAAHCPRWARDYNVVRFFGQDIDRQCVQMARAHMMLYGLNGFSARLTAAMQGAPPPVQALPPTQEVAPETPTVTLESGRLEQGGLFA
jgi:hypothetical protein